MTAIYNRRQVLRALCAAPIARLKLEGNSGKPLRGVFPIMSTPFTASGAVDFDDLVREVEFLDRCGAHGMVWPQNASLYRSLNKDERMRGMEVLAQAAKGKKPALVLGVQAANTGHMLEFARKAESLEPDALIAMPPYEAKSLDDYRQYYRALAGVSQRPIFIQTTGGAPKLDPPVELLVELAREFPQLGYVKEEVEPILERMKSLVKHRPPMKRVFSGAYGRAMTYEMRFGADGTMPTAPYTDVQAQIWDLYEAGHKEAARDLFSKLVLIINLFSQIRGVDQYIMKKRRVFKTAVARGRKGEAKDLELGSDEIAEIEYHFEALRPYLRA